MKRPFLQQISKGLTLSRSTLQISLGLIAALVSLAALAVPPTTWMDPNSSSNRWGDTYDSFKEERELVIQAPSELVVDAGKNGGISLHGWDKKEVRIIAKVNVNADSESDAEELFSKIKVIAEDKIYAEGPGNKWAVSFEIYAPKTLHADLEAFNGGISINHMTAKVQLRTVNGGISVTQSGGDIQGNTTNGGLRIECQGTSWVGQGLDLTTSNGGVSIEIPNDFNGELETGTVNGLMEINFPVTIQGEIDRTMQTVLGKGGPRIRAITTNGAVRVSN